MADFAQMLTQKALNMEGPDVAKAYKDGAQLALERERLALLRSKTQKDKKMLESTKVEKFLNASYKADKLKGQARKNYGTHLKRYRDSLNLTDKFPDETLEFVTASPENILRMKGLEARVKNGDITEEQGLAIIQDPTQFVDLTPEFLDESVANLAKAGSEQLTETGKDRRAQLVASASFERQERDIEAVGPKKQAALIETNWSKLNNAGGLSGAISKLRKIKSAMESFGPGGGVKTGGVGGVLKKAAGAVGLQGTLDPAYKQASDNLRASLNLKGSLDSQFSAKEAEQQYEMRTTDPTLKTEDNAGRARAIFNESVDDLRNSLTEFRSAGKDTRAAEAELAKLIEGSGANPQGGGSAPPAKSGQVMQQKLKDPEKLRQIKAVVDKDPSQLKAFADKFGVDPDLLKLLLDSRGQ